MSNLEEFIRKILKDNKISFEENTRKIINPLELDFFIPKYNIAFEINGNYWHSEVAGEKDSKYHINKTNLCNDIGIKLIHIFEDEILLKPKIVESEILKLINSLKNKIKSTDCEIKKVNFKDYKAFLETNNIGGVSIGLKNYGLYHKGELVYFMNFSRKSMLNKGSNTFELLSFCNKTGIEVVGGFEVLLNYFIKNNKPSNIISFIDCRWSGVNPKETVYNKNNFKYIENTKPNYFYVLKKDYLNRINRFSLRKGILLEMNPLFIKKQTEFEMAKKMGYDRIWDCGAMKFVLLLKNKDI